MQTPSHAVVSLFLCRKSENWKQTLAVVFGAFVPDINMFLFYGYQKWIGTPEETIWSTTYFEEHWQLFFDWFNSIPIYVALAALAYWLDRRVLFLIASSALVHVLCDLPVHNDDAHRHFLPFSHWRFVSPVSYWDPQHYGIIAASVEYITAVSMCVFLSFGKFAKSVRVSAGTNLALYVVVGGFVLSLLMRRWL